MSDHRTDWDRAARTGTTEAVLCDSKSMVQIAAILQTAESAQKRLSTDNAATLSWDALDYDPLSETAILGGSAHEPMDTGVGIVAAGTSDMPIASEVQRSLTFHGVQAPIAADVGAAGLSRLLDEVETLGQHRVLTAVAGMAGALFSVLAGLIRAPVIAVPALVCHGVAEGGRLARHATLGSCALGLLVMNIGNGFGGACAAVRILGAR